MPSMSDDEITTKYLVSLLTPEQRSELGQLLGKNSTVSANDPDEDDLAQDALQGRIAMDRLPPRLHRQAMARVSPRESDAERGSFDKLFPHANRLGGR